MVQGSAGTADGSGVVSHVGAALLRILADRAGLTAALSAGLGRSEVQVRYPGQTVGLWAHASMNSAAEARGLRIPNLNLQLKCLEADIGGHLPQRASHRHTLDDLDLKETADR